MREKRGKKAQVTIFIIIAIIIVAVLLILLYPRLKIYVTPVTPSGYIESCVKNELGVLDKIMEQGGSLEPENFISYQDRKIEYLCYTNEYYKTCKMQQPLLKEHVESELANYLKPRVEKCMNELVQDYRNKGYSVKFEKSDVSVELIPENIKIVADLQMTLTKESSQSFDKIVITEKSNAYDMIMIASAILNWEARYGDSAPETFMLYYPDLKIEKIKQGDGSKIYIMTNIETDEQFYFASRSLSWPAGYGIDEERVRENG